MSRAWDRCGWAVLAVCLLVTLEPWAMVQLGEQEPAGITVTECA